MTQSQSISIEEAERYITSWIINNTDSNQCIEIISSVHWNANHLCKEHVQIELTNGFNIDVFYQDDGTLFGELI